MLEAALGYSQADLMPFVGRDNFKIYYAKRSIGEPVLLISGFMADGNFWPPAFLRNLSKKHSLLLMDNRGTGKSDIPGESFSIKDLAQDAVSILDNEGLEKAHIIGISMGGMIAQEMAIEFPWRVNKLVLISTHFGGKNKIFPEEEDKNKLIPDNAQDEESNINRLLEVLYGSSFLEKNKKALFDFYLKKRKGKKILQHVIFSQINAVKNFNSENRLNRIKAPVFILHGTEDKIVKSGNAELLRQRIGDCSVKYYEGTGHSLPAEKAAIAAEDISLFLNK